MTTFTATHYYAGKFNQELRMGSGDAPTLRLWDRDGHLLVVFKMDPNAAFGPVDEDGIARANPIQPSEGLGSGWAEYFTLNDKDGNQVHRGPWIDGGTYVAHGGGLQVNYFELSVPDEEWFPQERRHD